MRVRVLCDDFPAARLRPDHEGIHGPLNMIRRMLLSLKITRSENHSQKYFGESLIFMIDWRCFFCPLAVWRESTQTEFGKLPDTRASDWSMSGTAGPLIGWPHCVQYTGASHRNRLENSETVSCPPPSVSASRGNYCHIVQAACENCVEFLAIPHKIFTRANPGHYGI